MLSLSMIVKNEESCIADCLNSVKDFVDEMVIIDTGSKDSTVSICKAMGARVEYLPWPGDFAPARNFALSHAKGDWILVLDADEKLIPECIPSLKSLISTENNILINLLRYEYGSLMSPYSNVSRLFRRHPNAYWSRPYHSIIDDSLRKIMAEENKWKIVDCIEPALIHHGYKPELVNARLKANRLRIAMEQWLEEYPNDPYACAKLGALEISEGFNEKGILLLQKGLNNLNPKRANILEEYELCLHLGIALTDKNLNQAINFYKQAMSLSIGKRISLGARLNLAVLLIRTGELHEALSLTRSATEIAPEIPICWYNLGIIERKIGNLIASRNAYLKSIELNQSYSEAYQNLGIVNLLLGDIVTARSNLQTAINLLKKQDRQSDAKTLETKMRGIINFDDSL